MCELQLETVLMSPEGTAAESRTGRGQSQSRGWRELWSEAHLSVVTRSPVLTIIRQVYSPLPCPFSVSVLLQSCVCVSVCSP